MQEVSILDQILNNQKVEEVGNLDAVEIINNLFSELTDREKDVLIRRYGLHSTGKETLESIGNAHSLTRERIRQIETTSVKKLQELKNLEEYIVTLKKVVYQLLEEHGGIIEREYLMDLLVGFSMEGLKMEIKNQLIHKNYLNFLITKLLNDEFEEFNNSKHFKSSYKIKFQSMSHLEDIITDVARIIHENQKIHTTDELIDFVKDNEAYKKHEEKITNKNILDIAKYLNNELFEENPDTINNNKVIYSIMKVAKKIEQNKFGHWGPHTSREIKPKTINDKIYLVLKNHKEPLHFAEIADKINNIGFDKKQANAATVHNELILDKKYVLVGRGLYGLKEWGFKKGTVLDVIEEILNEAGEPLHRDEIIKRVLNKRLVKKATIILALMNKDKFDRINGKYALKV